MVYTIKQVAAMLSVNPETIRREIERGNMDYFKVGNTYRIRPEYVENYIEKNKNK